MISTTTTNGKWVVTLSCSHIVETVILETLPGQWENTRANTKPSKSHAWILLTRCQLDTQNPTSQIVPQPFGQVSPHHPRPTWAVTKTFLSWYIYIYVYTFKYADYLALLYIYIHINIGIFISQHSPTMEMYLFPVYHYKRVIRW